MSPAPVPLSRSQPRSRRKLLEFSKSDVQDIMNSGGIRGVGGGGRESARDVGWSGRGLVRKELGRGSG